MKLTFTVNGQPGEVAVPDSDDLCMTLGEIHAGIIAACGVGTPDRYLQARLAEELLRAIDKGRDADLGEVLSPV